MAAPSDMDDASARDTPYEAYLQEQAEARLHDYRSGTPAAFARHMARIRQHPDGYFEHREADGLWYYYLPGGYPYHDQEIEALRARGCVVTETNVRERTRNEPQNDRKAMVPLQNQE
jgi:hypothetical protein